MHPEDRFAIRFVSGIDPVRGLSDILEVARMFQLNLLGPFQFRRIGRDVTVTELSLIVMNEFAVHGFDFRSWHAPLGGRRRLQHLAHSCADSPVLIPRRAQR